MSWCIHFLNVNGIIWELHLTIFHILIVFTSMPTDTFTAAFMPPFLCLISIEQTIVSVWMSYLHLQEGVGCWLVPLRCPTRSWSCKEKKKTYTKGLSFFVLFACLYLVEGRSGHVFFMFIDAMVGRFVEMNKRRYKLTGGFFPLHSPLVI